MRSTLVVLSGLLLLAACTTDHNHPNRPPTVRELAAPCDGEVVPVRGVMDTGRNRRALGSEFDFGSIAQQGPACWVRLSLNVAVTVFPARQLRGAEALLRFSVNGSDTAQITVSVDGDVLAVSGAYEGGILDERIHAAADGRFHFVFENYLPYRAVHPGRSVWELESDDIGAIGLSSLELEPPSRLRLDSRPPRTCLLSISPRKGAGGLTFVYSCQNELSVASAVVTATATVASKEVRVTLTPTIQINEHSIGGGLRLARVDGPTTIVLRATPVMGSTVEETGTWTLRESRRSWFTWKMSTSFVAVVLLALVGLILVFPQRHPRQRRLRRDDRDCRS
jgi:hypothetical protein